MPSLRFAYVAVVFLAAIAAGCGGGGGGNAPGSVVPGRGASSTVQVKIVVPEKTTNGRRRPAYISPSTQSVILEIVGPIATAAPSATPSIAPYLVGVGYANLTPGSSNCSTSASGLSCTVSVTTTVAGAGTYALLVVTTDATQTGTSCLPTPGATVAPSPLPSASASPVLCNGNILSFNVTEVTITPGSTSPVSVTLGGYPVYLQPVELLSGFIGGAQHGSGITVFGPATSSASFRLLDADKNVIMGNGALQLTATSTSTLTTSVSATPDATGLYTISLTPLTTAAGGQNVVTAGSNNVLITASVPNGLVNTVDVFTVPVTVMHSVVYVARSGGLIDAYLDGNTASPAYTVYGSGSSQLGLAVNPNDESLWVADSSNNDVVVFPIGLPGSAPGESVVFCGMGGNGSNNCGPTGTSWENPTYVSFDSGGNLYVSTYNGSIYQLDEYNAPSIGASPNPASAPNYSWSGSSTQNFGASALDANGNVYVGSTDFLRNTTAFLQFQGGSPTATTINSLNVTGVAAAPDGSVWALSEPSTGTGTATKLAVPGFATNATIMGITDTPYQGLAVDQLGNVYIAAGAGTGVQEYAASSSWALPATIGNSSTPTNVAVYPDGIYGANHPIGVANPTQSPIPIASPLQY